MEEIVMGNLASKVIILENRLLCMLLRIWKLWLSIAELIILWFKMLRDNFMHLDSTLKDN